MTKNIEPQNKMYSKKYCQNQNGILLEKANIPLSSKYLKESKTTYFNNCDYDSNQTFKKEEYKMKDMSYFQNTNLYKNIRDSLHKNREKHYSSIGLTNATTFDRTRDYNMSK